MRYLLLAAILAAPFLTGCATTVRGSTDILVVESDPVGADVRLSDGQTGKTPASFRLSRKKDLTVTISKPGYEPATVNVFAVKSKVGAPIAAGVAFATAGLSLIGDTASGAMNDLEPNPVRVALVPVAAK